MTATALVRGLDMIETAMSKSRNTDLCVVPMATLKRWEQYAEVCDGLPGEYAVIHARMILRGIRAAIQQNEVPE